MNALGQVWQEPRRSRPITSSMALIGTPWSTSDRDTGFGLLRRADDGRRMECGSHTVLVVRHVVGMQCYACTTP